MIETKRAFISGPMAGYEDLNFPAFFAAEDRLKEAGFSVLNPARFGLDGGFVNPHIAAMDINALLQCNYIYQLPGWEKSKGAAAEWSVALWAGIDTINENWLNWYIETKRHWDEDPVLKEKGENDD